MKLYSLNNTLVYEGDGHDLHHRDLSYVDFTDVTQNDLDLNNCRLTHSRFGNCKYYDFRYSNLACANFNGADISEAAFNYARLYSIRLIDAKINWNSRDLLSHLLVTRAGKDVEKLKIAGIIMVKRDWCWKDFLAIDDPLKQWALDVFHSYGLEKRNVFHSCDLGPGFVEM